MIIRFSGPLLRFMNYQKEHEVMDATTVEAAIDHLTLMYPNLKPVLYDTQGKVRAAHRLFLNGAQLRSSGIDMQVDSNACLEIITAIAGG